MAYVLSGLFIFAVLPSASVFVAWAQLGGAMAAMLALLLSPAWFSAALCVASGFRRHSSGGPVSRHPA